MTAEKPDAPVVVCPSCGHRNLEGVDECANCQADLRSVDVPAIAKRDATSVYLESIERLVRWDPPVFAGDAPLASALPQLRAHPDEPIIVLIDEETAAAVTSAGAVRCLPWRPAATSTIGDLVRDVPLMLLKQDSNINSALYRLSTDRLLFAPVKHESGRLGTISAVELLASLESDAGSDPFFSQPVSAVGPGDAVTLAASANPARAVEVLCTAPDPLVSLVDGDGRFVSALSTAEAFRLLDEDDDGADRTIASLLREGVGGLGRDEPVSAALRRMAETRLPVLPVVEGDRVAGVLRAVDLVIAYTEAHAEETLNLSPDPEQLMERVVAGGGGVD